MRHVITDFILQCVSKKRDPWKYGDRTKWCKKFSTSFYEKMLYTLTYFNISLHFTSPVYIWSNFPKYVIAIGVTFKVKIEQIFIIWSKTSMFDATIF